MQRALLASLLLVMATVPLSAQQGLRPAPSTRGTAEVSLTIPRVDGAMAAPASDSLPRVIRVDYGQPHLRGRPLHTDSLVPYDRPWRTGANAPTTLTTSVDLLLGGQNIPRGTYVLWTVPGRSGWRLMVQRKSAPGVEQPRMAVDATDIVARIDMRVETVASPLESLSMWLVPSLAPGVARGELRIGWGTSLVATDWVVVGS